MAFTAGDVLTAAQLNDLDINSLTVDTNVLVVDKTNDRVGIGDSTPSYKLDVNGTGRFTGELTLDGDLTGTSNTNFYVKNDSGEEILFQESSNQLYFKTNGVFRGYFTSGGDFVPYQDNSYDLAQPRSIGPRSTPSATAPRTRTPTSSMTATAVQASTVPASGS